MAKPATMATRPIPIPVPMPVRQHSAVMACAISAKKAVMTVIEMPVMAAMRSAALRVAVMDDWIRARPAMTATATRVMAAI
jgi:hypothetical protein